LLAFSGARRRRGPPLFKVLGKLNREALIVRQDGRQVARKMTRLAGQNNLALLI
jgi:hypothetical protein